MVSATFVVISRSKDVIGYAARTSRMTDWIPKRRARISDAPGREPSDLDRDERFLLTRVDGNLSVDDLSGLTGIAPTRVEAILQRLVARGAVDQPISHVVAEVVSDDEARHLPELEIVGDEEDDAAREDAGNVDTADEPTSRFQRLSDGGLVAVPAFEGHELEEVGPDDDEYDDDDIPLAVPVYASSASSAPGSPGENALDGLDGLDDVEGPSALEADTGSVAGPESAGSRAVSEVNADADADADAGLDDDSPGSQAGDLRQLYMSTFATMDTEWRIASAGLETGPRLLSLAFDPQPAVLRALFENPEAGPVHARLAAFHHRNAQGLEFLAQHNDLLRDPQVQRALLRNPQLSEILVRRILTPRRLIDIYKVSLDRDIPDRTRASSRTALRMKFTASGAEERFGLIWATEARCLQVLIGCTLDSKTTKMICGKPVTSVMLVQNFARWGATPPAILAHFLKQTFVRRQPPLRKVLLQHPNTPSDAKKNL